MKSRPFFTFVIVLLYKFALSYINHKPWLVDNPRTKTVNILKFTVQNVANSTKYCKICQMVLKFEAPTLFGKPVCEAGETKK